MFFRFPIPFEFSLPPGLSVSPVLRLEIRGLSDRQFLAENRNEIAPLAPKSPVHVVRERYSAPEVGARILFFARHEAV